MQDNANKDNHADVVVVEKRVEAAGGLPVTCEPLMVRHEDSRDADRCEIPGAEFSHVADENQRNEHQQLQSTDHEQVSITEKDSCRFDANFRIVFTIDHRVKSVVDDCPDECGAEDQPG